jgi:NADPH:quinone reductase-like Zn-dependent oxidoreductase
MKAIRVHSFGEADCLFYEDAPEPVFLEDEILIRVQAAGVNPVDTRIRSGALARFLPRLPAILGRDVSGLVAAVGRNVSGFAEGDSVFGVLDYDRGSYAEYAVASAREVTRVSAALAPSDLAGLPVAALTAWQALFEHGRLRKGQRVLIHAANGGVGHLEVQFAAGHGAEVIATSFR